MTCAGRLVRKEFPHLLLPLDTSQTPELVLPSVEEYAEAGMPRSDFPAKMKAHCIRRLL